MAGSFGERLRREREMRGVSLENIAEATKIGTRLLRALEEEHFELLPGGIFNKGFVRAYAKYLGLNEDEAVADYLQAAGESGPDPRLIAEQNAFRIDRSNEEIRHSASPRFPVIPVLILLVIVAAGWGGWKIYQDRFQARAIHSETSMALAQTAVSKSDVSSQSPENSAAANTSSQSQATSANSPVVNTQPTDSLASPARNADVGATPEVKKTAPTSNPGQTSKSATDASILVGATNTAEVTKTPFAPTPKSAVTGEASAPADAQAFEVSVRAKDRAWVSLKSDGKITVRGIISPPDVKTVRATKQVVFWTGNAGAVEISFNGQHIALAGGPNTEGTLVFNAHGVVIPTPALNSNQP